MRTVVDTRERLIQGTLETLRRKGIAGVSARAIAAAAGVNQALVFYHFGSVEQLIDVACRESAEARMLVYRDEFSRISSMHELVQLGRELHVRERAAGNVLVLAQVLAGAQREADDSGAGLAAGGRHAVGLWVAEIEVLLERLLRDSPLRAAIDIAGLARGVAASFIGIELYEGVDPEGAELAFSALEQLSVLIEVVEDLGPVARRALANRMRRGQRRTNGAR